MDLKFLLVIVMTIGSGRSFFLKSGKAIDVENLSDLVMETFSHYFTSHTDRDGRFRRAFHDRVKKNLQDSENQKKGSEDPEFVGNILNFAPGSKIPIEDVASTVKKLVLSYPFEAKTVSGTNPNMELSDWSWLTDNSKYDESFKMNILDSFNFLKTFINCLRESLPSTIEEKLFEKLSKCNCKNEIEKSVEEIEGSGEVETLEDSDVAFGSVEDSNDDDRIFIFDEVEKDIEDGELLSEETKETPVDSFDYVDSI